VTAESVNASIVDIDTTLSSRTAGAGTGMIISTSGLILTNNHVIEGARSIRVRLVTPHPPAGASGAPPTPGW